MRMLLFNLCIETMYTLLFSFEININCTPFQWQNILKGHSLKWGRSTKFPNSCCPLMDKHLNDLSDEGMPYLVCVCICMCSSAHMCV